MASNLSQNFDNRDMQQFKRRAAAQHYLQPFSVPGADRTHITGEGMFRRSMTSERFDNYFRQQYANRNTLSRARAMKHISQ